MMKLPMPIEIEDTEQEKNFNLEILNGFKRHENTKKATMQLILLILICQYY